VTVTSCFRKNEDLGLHGVLRIGPARTRAAKKNEGGKDHQQPLSHDVSPLSRDLLFKKIGPTDLAGLHLFPSGSFTPDGKYYGYSYNRILSELYVVDGLR
jgi:hypothetical protein